MTTYDGDGRLPFFVIRVRGRGPSRIRGWGSFSSSSLTSSSDFSPASSSPRVGFCQVKSKSSGLVPLRVLLFGVRRLSSSLVVDRVGPRGSEIQGPSMDMGLDSSPALDCVPNLFPLPLGAPRVLIVGPKQVPAWKAGRAKERRLGQTEVESDTKREREWEFVQDREGEGEGEGEKE